MPLHGWYSPGLVILSILVAGVASYAALELAARVAAARGGERLAWLAGGSLTMGLGIWSMHFVGMLAYHLPLRTTHSVRLVLLSLSVAIGAAAIALFIASRPAPGRLGLVAGALWMAPAIAGMHYIGMSGLNLEARLQYSPLLVAASVAIAVLASLAGLGVAYRSRSAASRPTRTRRMASGILVAGAIAAMPV